MGIFQAISDSVSGTLADQWIDIFTPDSFNEHSLVVPGHQKTNALRPGSNQSATDGILSKNSKIYVPENTAAFIFSETAIEKIITQPGTYEYDGGQGSIFSGDDVGTAIFNQIKDRVAYGGISADQKRVSYINLREIRNIKFGTKGPQIYNDKFYGADLEVFAYGTFTVKVVDPVILIRKFVPANVDSYSFDNKKVREHLLSEFLQSFSTVLNKLSEKYRISQLITHSIEMANYISEDPYNAGSWKERFGFEIVKVTIENIEFSDESRELVNQYSALKMNMKAYEGISKEDSNIAVQQKVADGVKDHGLGSGSGVVLGMDMVQKTMEATQDKPANEEPKMSLDEQIESLKKLKDLVDLGILTEEEFNIKKKEVLGL